MTCTNRSATLSLICCLVAGAFASAAGAADRPPDDYVTGGMYYLVPGSRPVDYGIGFDMGYGTRVGKSNWLEVKVFTSVLESGNAALPDFYSSGLGLDFLLPFGNQDRSHFYVMLGGGAALNDVTPDDGDGASFFG